MDERRICCCGASSWTKLIGWFQIISGIGLTIYLAVVLAKEAIYPQSQQRSPLGREQKANERFPMSVVNACGDDQCFMPTWIIVLIVVVLVQLYILMAVILLRGSRNKNVRQIVAWIVFNKIYMVLWVVGAIVKLYFLPFYAYFRALGSVCTGLIVQFFTIWVVGIHKKEIEQFYASPLAIYGV